jgi:diaminopimelate decarboxylase
MTELIRPALYGGIHPIVALTSLGEPVAAGGAAPPIATPAPPPTPALEPPQTIDGRPLLVAPEPSPLVAVHGPICESTDALGEHDLPPLRRGDLVAIRDAGASAASLSSTYNGRPRPPQVILTTDGRLVLARRRGSITGLA